MLFLSTFLPILFFKLPMHLLMSLLPLLPTDTHFSRSNCLFSKSVAEKFFHWKQFVKFSFGSPKKCLFFSFSLKMIHHLKGNQFIVLGLLLAVHLFLEVFCLSRFSFSLMFWIYLQCVKVWVCFYLLFFKAFSDFRMHIFLNSEKSWPWYLCTLPLLFFFVFSFWISS